MFEVSVWMVVTLFAPEYSHGRTIFEKQYEITKDIDAAVYACGVESLPWLKKAMTAKRGEWMLDVTCQVRHEEAEPAGGAPQEGDR